MITEIRLSQLKDTYTGNEDILIPLVNILQGSYCQIKRKEEEHMIYCFYSLKEAIAVHKSEEWIPEMQVYEPLPCFSYLVRALKLIVPESRKQSRVEVMIKIVNGMDWDEEIETALIESSKLKVLISKGDKFINAYANNIIDQENLSSKLSVFAELINNAEVDNGAE